MSGVANMRFDVRLPQWSPVVANSGVATSFARVYLPERQGISLRVVVTRPVSENVAIDQVAVTSVARDLPEAAPRRFGYPKIYGWLGCLVFVLIGAGIVSTATRPSEITQLGVPIGFTLWAVLAYLIGKSDRRHLNG
jgi:hypothetical protein